MNDTRRVFTGKKAVYYSLGCKLNYAEVSAFARELSDLGVIRAEKDEQADIVIINTCSVTKIAEDKSRHQIHSLVRLHPNAFVVVTGCYAQLSPERVGGIEGVDLVLGSNEKGRLIKLIADEMVKTGVDDAKAPESGKNKRVTRYITRDKKDITTFAPSCARGNRTRYFLKVQDGCDYFCTYCAIPYARGLSRNPSIASLKEQAEAAAREGGKEIVLTGVNIGDFGRTTGESFLDLVKTLDGVKGISRYRISSIEPDLLTDELIDYCAHSRAFMPHFHIPLQSGSDRVLRLMRRRYTKELFAEKIGYIKEVMPEAFIGVDVMTGSRGETPDCFDETYSLLLSLPVTELHVFPYSERAGTAALKIPYKVDEDTKKERCRRLITLSETKKRAFYASHIGKQAEVLFEKAPCGRRMRGFTRNYIRVERSPGSDNSSADNTITDVCLGGFNSEGTALTTITEKRIRNKYE